MALDAIFRTSPALSDLPIVKNAEATADALTARGCEAPTLGAVGGIGALEARVAAGGTPFDVG